MVKRSVSMIFLAVFTSYLRSQNVDIEIFLKSLNIDSSKLEDREARIEANSYNRLYLKASEKLNDELFGFHVGRDVQPKFFGVVGYAMMSSKSLQQAISIHSRYQQLVGTFGDTKTVQEGENLRVVWETEKEASYHVAEKSMASWVAFGRWITQTEKSPLQVNFNHSHDCHSEQAIAELEAYFGCLIQFSQPATSILLTKELLHLPVAQYDQYLYELMKGRAEKALDALSSRNQLVSNIQSTLTELMVSELVTIDTVADKLGISARTLQRQLKEQNTNFNELLDQTRIELVEQMLPENSMSLADIAFGLGFSEQSSFQRAFKRWFQMTPGQYRKNLNNQLNQ